MLLVVGLRNFGFNGTRHNVAEAVLFHLAKRRQIGFSRKDGMEIAQYSPNVCLALPRTYMNLSGKPVKQMMEKPYNAGNLLVCHDELDLPVGKVKLKKGGSARGHNGIKSIISSLGGLDTFNRINIGIDRPASRDAAVIADYVLKKFDTQQTELLHSVALDLSADFIEQEIEKWEKGLK